MARPRAGRDHAPMEPMSLAAADRARRGGLPHRARARAPIRWVLGALLGAWAVAGAQAPAPEVWARDLREEVVRIDVTVQDLHGRQETRAIPLTLYRPAGEGPHPLVVFNHGRAPGDQRAKQVRARFEHAARYLVQRGFVVIVPTRVGYGDTYGDFDPEASGPCHAKRFGPMSEAASEQVLAAVRYAATLPYVDPSRWLVAGQSVGGMTAVATVARQPAGLLGGISFAGGSGGEPDARPGNPCSADALGRYWGSLARPGLPPMLWLYWQQDRYWGDRHPPQWHRAWTGGGAQAEFHHLPAIDGDGHFGLDRNMEAWMPLVDAFLARLGFTPGPVAARPAATGWAAVTDVSAVPISAQSRETGYARFLAAKPPRAFAVGDRGAWGFATAAGGDYVTGRALGLCQRSGQTCRLYAVDDDVVWTGPGGR